MNFNISHISVKITICLLLWDQGINCKLLFTYVMIKQSSDVIKHEYFSKSSFIPTNIGLNNSFYLKNVPVNIHLCWYKKSKFENLETQFQACMSIIHEN